MPSIGNSFSALQASLLQNAKLVNRTESTGGMDGVWRGPVHDVREDYDTNGDGKADVSIVTREQDAGAWSYDGTTGKQIAGIREIQLRDASGRITDTFDSMTALRKNGQLVTSGEMRGEREQTDFIGTITHTDYQASGERDVTYQNASAKDDGSGNAVVDLSKLDTQHWTFKP
jgi:hypothetical protein